MAGVVSVGGWVAGRGPQRWKMLVVLFACVVATQYPLTHSAAYHRLLASFPALSATPPPQQPSVLVLLLTDAMVVAVVVYVTLPLALVVLRAWVFAPWQESRVGLLRCLQKGIPCLS